MEGMNQKAFIVWKQDEAETAAVADCHLTALVG